MSGSGFLNDEHAKWSASTGQPNGWVRPQSASKKLSFVPGWWPSRGVVPAGVGAEQPKQPGERAGM